jgi:hypothetical protein
MENHIGVIFENAGLIDNGKPVIENIRKATVSRIIDLCSQSCDMSSHETIDNRPSIFSYAVSPSLGGGKNPCSSPICRLKKVKELTQFAVLYSDKVYIKNFFYDYTHWPSSGKRLKAHLIRSFVIDLSVFCALLPLIEAGKLQIATFRDICPHCLSIMALQKNAKSDYENACQNLQKKYYKEVTYSLRYEHDELSLVASGPDFFIPHGRLINYYRDPEELLAKIPQLAKKAMVSGEIILTTAQARKIEAGELFCNPVIDSIAFDLGAAHFFNSSYLSDSDLEIQFIRNLTIDPITRRRAALMQKYLTCIVPFIEFVDAASLIKLRDREEEAFILFRAALAKAVEEYKTAGDTFTEKDAQAVYADIIQPRLATLDAKIHGAKIALSRDGVRKVVGWTGAISIGIYADIFTANPLLEGAAVLGAVKVGAELIETIMAKSDSKKTIRKDDLYFLWRVKEMAEASISSHPSFIRG